MDSVLKINYLKVFLATMLIFSVVPMASSQESKDLENAELRNKYQNEFIELYDQKLYLQRLRPAKELDALKKE